MDSPEAVLARYQELQAYVAWTPADCERILLAAADLAPHIPSLTDDFYDEIHQHPEARAAITGGPAQIALLKQTLGQWMRELFAGSYDEDYVAGRWRVGMKHAEIRLPQIYMVAAMSRLRNGMMQYLSTDWRGDAPALLECVRSLNKLLDLDLAIMIDAYETEFLKRQQEAERRRLHDELHQEREISAGLFAHAQAAILVLDGRGRIARCNPYFERLVAGTQRQLKELDWFEAFVPAAERARLREALLDSPPAAVPTPITVSSTLPRGGRNRNLFWSGVPLRDAAGMPFAVLIIGHDVTDLHDAQQRTLQTERLAAIGQMATGLAHESRNALQRIGASAEMLELDLAGNEEALELVGRIQKAQSHLHQLLEEVRNYAAPIMLDRSPCRISEVWREAWELLASQRAGRKVELIERISTRNLTIEGDRFRLVQVFRNVLENSLAACQDPVRIEVTCDAAMLGERPAVRVSLRDSGQGLDAEQRRRIFEPFYTTKPTGTGLGMAIVQRIVTAHGGEVSIGDNAPGAQIIVTLPAQA